MLTVHQLSENPVISMSQVSPRQPCCCGSEQQDRHIFYAKDSSCGFTLCCCGFSIPGGLSCCCCGFKCCAAPQDAGSAAGPVDLTSAVLKRPGPGCKCGCCCNLSFPSRRAVEEPSSNFVEGSAQPSTAVAVVSQPKIAGGDTRRPSRTAGF